jgi:hypothetical protein
MQKNNDKKIKGRRNALTSIIPQPRGGKELNMGKLFNYLMTWRRSFETIL